MTRKALWLLLDCRCIGEIESHVAALAEALTAENLPAEVHFIKRYGPHPLEQRLMQNGVRVRFHQGALSLAMAAFRERPGLLHGHGYKASLLAKALGLILRLPRVSTYHAGDPGHAGNPGTGLLRLYTWLDETTAGLGKGIAVSDAIRSRIAAGMFGPDVERIDNFVTVPPKPKDMAAPERIAFVGRLAFEKGPDMFCDLAALNPDLSFHFFGDGPMRPTLEAIFGSKVQFHGRTDMATAWPSIGLLCLPSRAEGLPMAALEAMARGIPVAAFAVGALPTLIADSVNGFLAPAGDVRGLSDRVRRWQSLDASERYTLVDAARRTIQESYSPRTVLPGLLTLYRQAGWS